MKNTENKDKFCACGSKIEPTECCLRLIRGELHAATPEQLMRSRYVAFANGHVDYLLETSSNELKATLTKEDLRQSIDTCSFIKLEIKDFRDDWVEFIAHYLIGNEHHLLHEKSNFIQENGCWKYDKGQIFETPFTKLSRNDVCPCGSGKKFKKCHQQLQIQKSEKFR